MVSKFSILIRCITKKESGFGHLRRCLILAKQLQKKKCSIQFAIDTNKNTKKLLEQHGFSYLQFKNNISLKKEYTILSKIIKEKNFNMIILDARERNELLSKFLISDSIFSIVIDDAWCKYAYANLVFNSTISKEFYKYIKTKNNNKIFCGVKYFITDENFFKSKKKLNSIKKKNKYNITISIGGSDFDNLTYLFTNALLDLENINIKLVLGPYFSHRKKLNMLLNKNKNIQIINSPKNIWDIFLKSDVVISNAGSTLYELSIQKIPTLYVATEKHQINYAKEFETKGFGRYLGYKNKITSNQIKNNLEVILNDVDLRKNMVKMNTVIHGNGSKVITNEILKYEKIIKKKSIIIQ
jgi:UDP-2,4-diacetamido-2,4,6-trideoxy-beta-L-altropyranose hydrolase